MCASSALPTPSLIFRKDRHRDRARNSKPIMSWPSPCLISTNDLSAIAFSGCRCCRCSTGSVSHHRSGAGKESSPRCSTGRTWQIYSERSSCPGRCRHRPSPPPGSRGDGWAPFLTTTFRWTSSPFGSGSILRGSCAASGFWIIATPNVLLPVTSFVRILTWSLPTIRTPAPDGILARSPSVNVLGPL